MGTSAGSEQVEKRLNRYKGSMRPPESRKEDWLIAFLLASIHTLGVTLVYHVVPEPYMDEIFHVRQTRRYCVGDMRWDPMITTPPALYFLALPFCGGYERYTNSLIIFFTYPALCRFRRIFAIQNIVLPSAVALFLPVLLHSSLLFYTDLLSLCFVMWGFSIKQPLLSFPFFTLACLTRQNNIVWAALYALVFLLQNFSSRRPFYSLLSNVFKLWSFVLLAISFLVFVFVNKGIVLGDPSAHHPVPHFSQWLYFLLFTSLHSWPSILANYSTILSKVLEKKNILLLVLIATVIHNFSYDHAYLLADNRHVPFYLWRWWLSDAMKRVSLTPVYVLSLIFMAVVADHVALPVQLLFHVSSMLILVPARLIEPRYFIIPYVLFKLASSSSTKVSLLELLSSIAVFSVLFILFLFYPFEWANEAGVKQRFMW